MHDVSKSPIRWESLEAVWSEVAANHETFAYLRRFAQRMGLDVLSEFGLMASLVNAPQVIWQRTGTRIVEYFVPFGEETRMTAKQTFTEGWIDRGDMLVRQPGERRPAASKLV